jgi:hypothetical protein
MATEAEVERLADAMWQLLDDMGEKRYSVCGMAKAEARVAFEPFRDKSEPEYDDWMSYDAAKRLIEEVEGSKRSLPPCLIKPKERD